jgi:hypothetical protein
MESAVRKWGKCCKWLLSAAQYILEVNFICNYGYCGTMTFSMYDDVSPNNVSPNEKSRMFRPSNNASLGQCGPRLLRPLDMASLINVS